MVLCFLARSPPPFLPPTSSFPRHVLLEDRSPSVQGNGSSVNSPYCTYPHYTSSSLYLALSKGRTMRSTWFLQHGRPISFADLSFLPLPSLFQARFASTSSASSVRPHPDRPCLLFRDRPIKELRDRQTDLASRSSSFLSLSPSLPPTLLLSHPHRHHLVFTSPLRLWLPPDRSPSTFTRTESLRPSCLKLPSPTPSERMVSTLLTFPSTRRVGSTPSTTPREFIVSHQGGVRGRNPKQEE